MLLDLNPARVKCVADFLQADRTSRQRILDPAADAGLVASHSATSRYVGADSDIGASAKARRCTAAAASAGGGEIGALGTSS
jgi:hypothetical protein